MVNEIILNVNGQKYDNFLKYEIVKDIEQLSGSFDITATSTDDYNDNPIEPQDPIVITVDDEPIMTGYADSVSVSYSTDSHTIQIKGRDKTMDFIDSTLGAQTFNTPIGFEALLKMILEKIGYEVVSPNKRPSFYRSVTRPQISIINNYGTIDDFSSAEAVQLRNSESGFNLILRCAEKRQLILNSDGNGNIVIDKIGSNRALTILQNIKNNSSINNNIISASVNRNFSQRFYRYTVKSMTTQGSTGGVYFNQDDSKDPLSNSSTPQVGSAIDPEVRQTRIYNAIGSTASIASDCVKRANWEANIRKVRSFDYECEIFGFRQNLQTNLTVNPLWMPNQLAYVVDEYAGIDDELLIKTVKFTQDLEGGSKTNLTLVDKLAFSESIYEPLLKRKKQNNTTPDILFPLPN